MRIDIVEKHHLKILEDTFKIIITDIRKELYKQGELIMQLQDRIKILEDKLNAQT